ncbi:MAG: hypothetical protein ABII71_04035 [Candidatus Micrarchaeota archaeon]
MRNAALLMLLFLLQASFADGCPAGASDCFLCGGTGGIPCTTDCEGVWDEASHGYLACSCPQGEPCECYCPFEGKGESSYAECRSDSDCPAGYGCFTNEETLITNCPRGEFCSVCSKVDDGDAAGDSACPAYSSLQDCISRCTTDNDPCAAYIGSCDYMCRNSFPDDDIPQGPEPPEIDISELPECQQICVRPHLSCYQSCGEGNGGCHSGCDSTYLSCMETSCGYSGVVPERGCDGVICPEFACAGDYSNYGGHCEPSEGRCAYTGAYYCYNGCDTSSGQCIAIEKNLEPPIVSVSFSKPSVFLNGRDSAEIFVTVLNSTGDPVKGARVYLRVNDPKNSGVLGIWGFRDAYKYTDEFGIVQATLSFPSLNSIYRTDWESLPYGLEVSAQVSKHDERDDWTAFGSGELEMRSPAPVITSVSIEPDPAQAYLMHNIRINIQDPDGSKAWVYTITNFGGEFEPGHSHVVYDREREYSFASEKNMETVQWMSPARGLNKNEIVFAREMMGVGKGAAINGVYSVVKTHLVKKAVEMPSKFATNAVPVVVLVKSTYEVTQSTGNIIQGISDISQSQSTGETVYRSLDLTVEGVKLTIGIVTFLPKEIPVVGFLTAAAEDIVADFVLGSAQAALKAKANQQRILAAQTLERDDAFIIKVSDEDGFESMRTFDFRMEYLGFAETTAGG